MKKFLFLAFVLGCCGILQAQSYTIMFHDTPYGEGDTILYFVQDYEAEGGLAAISLYVHNNTATDLLTDDNVETINAPSGMTFAGVCAGGNCPQQGPFTVPANSTDENPLTVEVAIEPSVASDAAGLFKVTVGEAPALANPTIAYLRVLMPNANGIAAVSSIQSKVYPNPASHQVSIQHSGSAQAQLYIYNSLGVCVKHTALSSNNSQVDISTLSAGLYTYVIADGSQASQLQKLLVVR